MDAFYPSGRWLGDVLLPLCTESVCWEDRAQDLDFVAGFASEIVT